MPNLILTVTGWESRIRDKLGVDQAYLPNSVLQQPEIIGVAEAFIIDQIPDYATLEGTDRLWLEAATVCAAAALACSQMSARLPTSEQTSEYRRENSIDWERRREQLEQERDSYLARLIPFLDVPHFETA